MAPLAGALLGFLRYNFNPASIFLGDCGSLTIGFLLGCYGIIWSQKSATMLGMTAPLMALAIPLLDTGLAIGRRFLRHQPIFGADRNHIHHQLLDRGLSPRRVALILYGVGGIAAVFSLMQSMYHNRFSA
jgi:UDP-GlcNAc:undecaprenyl-phosphate GlcNAc-1-phosphate transferase